VRVQRYVSDGSEVSVATRTRRSPARSATRMPTVTGPRARCRHAVLCLGVPGTAPFVAIFTETISATPFHEEGDDVLSWTTATVETKARSETDIHTKAGV
jgi:hypothetical protein